jgi:carotenoid cleavage dioxygenase-like enzyme
VDRGEGGNVIEHGGRLLALSEAALPELTSDLETVGAWDFGGKLTSAMTVHPSRRWTIDLAAGTVKEQQTDDLTVEFPTINDSFTGSEHRFQYALSFPDDLGIGTGPQPTTAFSSLGESGSRTRNGVAVLPPHAITPSRRKATRTGTAHG